ncbi:MAG: NTP transferase domain-containing protein [Gemmatimonadota bacterium]
MSPLSLVILAAGRGSRFRGPKQLAAVGPSGEVLMAYSIHDAVGAGFQHFVIVTRAALQDPIERALQPVAESHGAVLSITVQTEPPGQGHEEAPRPWGPGHAVLCAGTMLTGPFGAANADDWYGPEAYRSLAAALDSASVAADTHHLVTYPVGNTLNDTEGVSRARCFIRPDGSLEGIAEVRDVRRIGDRVAGRSQDGTPVEMAPEAPVSTNLWGFQASILDQLEPHFLAFRESHAADTGREFLLPAIIHRLLVEGAIRVDTVPTREQLFGLTRQADLPIVRARIAGLVASGHYPLDLRSG